MGQGGLVFAGSSAVPIFPQCVRRICRASAGFFFSPSFFFFFSKCMFCECANAVTFRRGRLELWLWLPAALPLVREMRVSRATCKLQGLWAPTLSCNRGDEFPEERKELVSRLSPCARRCQALHQPSALLLRILSLSFLHLLPASCNLLLT